MQRGSTRILETTYIYIYICAYIPVVQYSFGIINWKISELKKIDTKTRKLLNMRKMLHPKADVERLYIPRKDGGRGLIDVETAFKTATIGLITI